MQWIDQNSTHQYEASDWTRALSLQAIQDPGEDAADLGHTERHGCEDGEGEEAPEEAEQDPEGERGGRGRGRGRTVHHLHQEAECGQCWHHGGGGGGGGGQASARQVRFLGDNFPPGNCLYTPGIYHDILQHDSHQSNQGQSSSGKKNMKISSVNPTWDVLSGSGG